MLLLDPDEEAAVSLEVGTAGRGASMGVQWEF